MPDQLELEDWHTIFWRPVITMRRRTTWKTMSEALSVRNTPFFKTWHDEVFEIWETHHLVPCAEGVTLATPSWAEAAVFSETTGLGEGWDALPELEVPVGFLMAGDATATLGEELTSEMVWRPPVVANERVMDAGHLVSLLLDPPFSTSLTTDCPRAARHRRGRNSAVPVHPSKRSHKPRASKALSNII
jgi:hypothetical protein